MAIASTLLSSALKSSFWNPENLCGVGISFNLTVNWWVRLALFLRIPQGFWTSSLHSYLCLPSLTVASSIPSLGSNVSMPGIQMQLRLSRPGWCGVACSKGSKWGRVSLEDCGSLRSACAVSCLHIPPLLCLWRVPGVISPVLGCVFMSLERLLWHPGNSLLLSDEPCGTAHSVVTDDCWPSHTLQPSMSVIWSRARISPSECELPVCRDWDLHLVVSPVANTVI